jgi:hypothetical protein
MNLQPFAQELTKRVQQREPSAAVKIMETPATPLTGEYLAVIDSVLGVEMYLFNPVTKQWIINYQA